MSKLDAMSIFAAVVDNGSFTGAARQLGLPKSTVSQRVAELEQGLKLRLLHRTTRKLSLTEAGQLYLGFCRRIVETGQAADAALSRLSGTPAGNLRLTAPEASGRVLLPQLLAQFRRRHPQVTVTCILADEQLDLVAERIDLALRAGRMADSSFVSRRLGPVRRLLVAAPDYLSRQGMPSTPEALAQHALLVHDGSLQWPLRHDGGIYPLTPAAPTHLANNLGYLRSLALAGEGIAMLPLYLCRDDLMTGRLHTVLESCPPLDNIYYAIYPSRRHPSAALLALLDFLVEYRFERLLTGVEP
ncbi:LysR family transcriptional regulator [Paludibacterium yongneupense]|uniref:LysR family transcriptional regulator n=1 Tax=Paludibacterium yongneupense TaxID=400061 RepID=UPI000415CEFD|nr:LysR family transcriptional regulator [Paludibacterium yongneupense]